MKHIKVLSHASHSRRFYITPIHQSNTEHDAQSEDEAADDAMHDPFLFCGREFGYASVVADLDHGLLDVTADVRLLHIPVFRIGRASHGRRSSERKDSITPASDAKECPTAGNDT